MQHPCTPETSKDLLFVKNINDIQYSPYSSPYLTSSKSLQKNDKFAIFATRRLIDEGVPIEAYHMLRRLNGIDKASL